MKKIFTVIIILITLNGVSQNFAPPGATWYYSYANFAIEGYVKISYENDTTIQGIQVQKLAKNIIAYDFVSEININLFDGFEYTYSDNDHVYWWVNNEFKVLYDFTVQVGDTVMTYEKVFGGDYEGDCDPFGRSLVTEAGVDTINGTALRWYIIEDFENSPVFFSGKIYERVGSMVYLFGMPGGCDIIYEEGRGPLRCYSDDDFPEYKNPGYQGECDFVVGIDEITNERNYFNFYPNPANDKLTIEIKENVSINSISIFTLDGKLIKETPFRDLNFDIDISGLQAGIYLIEVETEDGYRELKRLVIK